MFLVVGLVAAIELEMATGGHGDQRRQSDNKQVTLNHEDRLRLLSEGSFRCRPCLNCGNSDPRFIDLEGGQSGDGVGRGAGNGEDAGGTEAAQRLRCKKCDKPYTLLTSIEEDFSSVLGSDGDINDDDGLDFAGLECCNCPNKEPACFSVSHHDNGHLRSITCLICNHGNTFHESGASSGGGPSLNDGEWGTGNDAAGVEFSGSRIECIKCPNTDANLFDVTLHPDGRIHKVTCKKCGHGNTFRTQPEQAVAICNNQRGWGLWSAVTGAALIVSPLWNVAQGLVQKSAQSAWNQASQQVSDNVQNNRPVAEGLRQVGAGQAAALGRNLVLELGDKFLKKLLPDTAAKALTRNLSDVVSQYAMKLLAAGLEKKKATAKAKTPAKTKIPADAKPPADA